MNNMSAEIAAAAGYSNSIRLFTVAQSDGARNTTEQQRLPKIEQRWQPASPKGLGGASFSTFSAVCWLYGSEACSLTPM